MKNKECKFIGSFYKLSQLPKDNRPQIAFAGRSNVGKSSLLNKLTGRKKLAKVSQTPGKTRALNFFLIDDKFYYVDLPGYGYAKVSKSERDSWGELINDYLAESDNLVGLMLLLDIRRDPNTEDIQLLDWLVENNLPCIPVLTKADKLTRDKINRKVFQIKNDYGLQAIPFSTVNGIGKDELTKSIKELLDSKN